MMLKPFIKGQNERGALTVLFILISALLIGIISYSLYVGQIVRNKIDLQNAGDAASLAMAQHASQGLNMIAANNLAIGAGIHINSSVEILAAYLSIVRALAASATDLVEVVSAANDIAGTPYRGLNDTIQKDVWDRIAPMSSYVFQIAAGGTEFNDFIRDYWLLPAPMRGVESLRLNYPDAIMIPLQISQLQSFQPKMPLMRFGEQLKKTSPKSTICQSIRASRSMEQGQRDNILNWLAGPLASLGLDAGPVSRMVDKIISHVNKYAPLTIGHLDCGFGLKTPLFSALNGFTKGIFEGNKFEAHGASGALGSGVVGRYVDKSKEAFDCGDLDAICKGQEVGCNEVIGRITEAVGKAGGVVDLEFGKAEMLSQSIEKMREHPNSYSCQGQAGFIPVVDANNNEQCFSIAAIEPNCPRWEAAHNSAFTLELVIASPICPNRGYMEEQLSDSGACATFNAWRKVSQANDKPQADSGLAIMRTGQQAEAYSEQGVHVRELPHKDSVKEFVRRGAQTPSILEKARRSSAECKQNIDKYMNQQLPKYIRNPAGDKQCTVYLAAPDDRAQSSAQQLAFLIPLTGEGEPFFEAALRFATIATVPLRSRREIPTDKACPLELKVKDSHGTERCDSSAIIGLITHKGADSAAAGKALDFMNLNHGGLTRLVSESAEAEASLSSGWQRSMWTLSEARIKHRPGDGDPIPSGPEMRLFFPAWQARFSNSTAASLASSLTPILNNAASVNLISQVKGDAAP